MRPSSLRRRWPPSARWCCCRAIPASLQFPSGNVRAVIGALGNARLMVSVTFTATLMAAVYVVFTYFAPLIEVSAGSNPEARTVYLVLFGLGAMGGNYMGGYLSDRVGPLRTLRAGVRGAYRAAAAVLRDAVAPACCWR